MTDHIFIILMDIPAEFEDRFNHIYDTDHLLHMMRVPGNIRCDRYRLSWSDVPGMLKYLAVYEIAEPELPRNPEWQAQGKLGAWTTEMRDRVTMRRNGVFRRIAEHRTAQMPANSPPARDCIYFLQQAVPETIDERFNRLYDQDHIPLMLETPGVKDCRRYHLEWTASGDVPEYLTIYGLENPEVPRSPAWKVQTNKGAWPVEIRPNFTARRNGAYSRIAEHLAP